ncbi:hypothetical protein HanIR_Chr15g0762231 [Helianthus annuus]|nr:hypothetical protein HanIR_Chr15g0762231 [Helianthus annuus]
MACSLKIQWQANKMVVITAVVAIRFTLTEKVDEITSKPLHVIVFLYLCLSYDVISASIFSRLIFHRPCFVRVLASLVILIFYCLFICFVYCLH